MPSNSQVHDVLTHADLLSTGEAARVLSLSAVTVLAMAKDGRLRTALMAGGYRFFDRSDVEALAQKRAQEK